MKLLYLLICIVPILVLANENLPVVELPPDLNYSDVDKYLSSLNIDLTNGTDCKRPCQVNQFRICYKQFFIENYHAMGPACGNCSKGIFKDCFAPQCVTNDGFEKGIVSINRQVPGPLIEVCFNDLIVIDVYNLMISETFTMHWHGITHRKTPYMDGVPYVTQCPIIPKTSFRYSFYADEYGTNLYHSHSGEQRYNGAYGGLIVRKPDVDTQTINFYEHDLSEHTMIISDWSHESGEMFLIGLPTRKPGLLPQSLLINGFGKFYDNATKAFTPTPYETFYVTPGQTYRFRIIDAGSMVCPVQIQIQDHSMTVIAIDGEDIVPITVDTVYLTTGERIDVVIEAKNTTGMYWIHYKAMSFCTKLPVYQDALLSYDPPALYTDLHPDVYPDINGYPLGRIFNHPLALCNTTKQQFCTIDLVGLQSYPYNEEVTHKEYLALATRPINATAFFAAKKYTPFLNIDAKNIYLATVNGLSNIPATYPLLSQGSQNNFVTFCNERKIPGYCSNMQVCTCTHIISIEQNAFVEFVIFDESRNTNPVIHPIHLHGSKFIVLAEGRRPGEVLTVDKMRAMEANGDFKSHNPNPVLRDTITVLNQGYAVIRFKANNPGFWNLHCHIEDHMVFGMGLNLAVKGPIPSKPIGFPTCGNFPQ